jgi:hypothetical protein
MRGSFHSFHHIFLSLTNPSMPPTKADDSHRWIRTVPDRFPFDKQLPESLLERPPFPDYNPHHKFLARAFSQSRWNIFIPIASPISASGWNCRHMKKY